MKMLIGGQKVDSQSGDEIKVFNPVTGELVDTVPSATKEDIELCLDKAQKGKEEWSAMPLYARTAMMMKCADAIDQHRKEIATLLTRETGKIIKESEAEANRLSIMLRLYAEKANHLYGEVLPDNQPGLENDIIFTRREPLGVIVCIVPFNYPILLLAHKIVPALAGGNAVIVKPSSENPLAIIRATEILLEAGIPGNALQVVTGKGSTVGKWLVATPKVNAVSLTGSTEVGVDIMKESAPYLHRLFLELGGNDALIVLDDANLPLAVQEAAGSRVINSGQVCFASKRFLVHKSIKDRFAEALVERLGKVVFGDPMDYSTDVGCMINEKAAIEVEEQIQHTINQGARCIAGGHRYNKTFFQPTVLVDVTPEMDIAKDMEVFGPVFPIIEFETVEEAIRIANQTKYGLNCGIISPDVGKAMKIASKIECGTPVINGGGAYRHNEMAFGGYKMSGMGREGVSYTLEEMTQLKTYVLKSILK